MLRIQFVRYVLFCAFLIGLLFSGWFTVGTFFIATVAFLILENVWRRKGIDRKTGNALIDYGWFALLLVTLTVIFVYRDLIVHTKWSVTSLTDGCSGNTLDY